MVDSAVTRQSSMDVTLEPQIQLVSRIGLALKNSNKLSFLHGKIGVGKSHVANLLQQNLPTIHVVKLQIKHAMEPEQLKQQIIC
jgi:type II secretory pathway predicted ATPase ExeA